MNFRVSSLNSLRTHFHKRMSSTSTLSKPEISLEAEAKCLQGANDLQAAMMEEMCIVVDSNDKIIGQETKKTCHLNSQIFGEGLLHRAFSAFIFNSKGELLLQQRSNDKITFPGFWANSCCSHPLYLPDEIVEEKNSGVICAARRKIEQELGISPEELPVESFKFLTKVHYKAHSNLVWGEHEIDHILFCQPPKDVVAKPNPNEVSNARYFSMEELDDFVENSGELLSPWFKIIHNLHLKKWWKALLNDKLDDINELDIIHRAVDE